MCLGMKHIHDRKIIHRDIKGANVFLTKKGIVKIGDFGIAKVLSQTLQKARTMVGTPYYLSPEIIQSKPYNSKTDIWSMGVMLYELCALKPPFDAPSIHLLSMKIVRGVYNPIPAQYSPELKNLIKQMLEIRTEMRPDVNKILKMPLIQRRIRSFLSETVVQEEFSHTVLHKQNVFAFKPKPALQEQEVKDREDRLAYERKKMEEQKLAAQKQQLARPPSARPTAAEIMEQKRKENAAKYMAAVNNKPGGYQ